MKVVRNIKSVVEHKLAEFDSTELQKAGLNLQAVFDIRALPQEIQDSLKQKVDTLSDFNQLILLGHFGNRLWAKQKSLISERNPQVFDSQPTDSQTTDSLTSLDHPIDDYSTEQVRRLLSTQYPQIKTKLLYPNNSKEQQSIRLQQLGELIGWHAESPLKVGINQHWGTWFAYRVALLSNSCFTPTAYHQAQSPCLSCQTKACIASCPAKAVSNEQFELDNCIQYRQLPDSMCGDRCLARLSCPVGKQHRYSLEQIQYHYGHSLKMIKTFTL